MGHLSPEEKLIRKAFLEQVNQLLDYARTTIPNYRHSVEYHASFAEACADLNSYGRVTTLRVMAKVERTGWKIADSGAGYVNDIGCLIARAAEAYRSGYPIGQREVDELRDEVGGHTALFSPEPKE